MTLATPRLQDIRIKINQPLDGYSVVSHGGIGDEHREY